MRTWNVYRNGKYLGFVDLQNTLYADDQAGNPVIGKLDADGRFSDTGSDDLDGQKAALFPFEVTRFYSPGLGRMTVGR